MEIEIFREDEVFSDNKVRFGIRLTNNEDIIATDVQVILDYSESLFELEGNNVLKLGSAPPATLRTVKFILKSLGCVHKESIKATITYNDHKWEKHVIPINVIQYSSIEGTSLQSINTSKNNNNKYSFQSIFQIGSLLSYALGILIILGAFVEPDEGIGVTLLFLVTGIAILPITTDLIGSHFKYEFSAWRKLSFVSTVFFLTFLLMIILDI
ncbi:hypothetical protein V7O62_03700 [Methanolobus sp. ZRKC2]|uniref:hypothetical protein n=1 Tax=Methanolobus sp. ZRKC2 TaxID=3125783 RepID=UPI00324CB96E